MQKINITISNFVQNAINENLLNDTDRIYITNRLLDLLQLKEYKFELADKENSDLLENMDQMVNYAREKHIIDKTNYQKEQYEAAIMDLITPYPSKVNDEFWKKYDEQPLKATEYYYNLSQKNDYIKTRNIEKNIHFTSDSIYGELEITINLSKPEKDPKEIEKARTSEGTSYPQCALCMENEGYRGHVTHAARQNHRIVRFELNDEIYGLQYSPYVYYNEHSIFLNEEHKPMRIDRKAFKNLLSIVEIFPHYFAGSNADLPIVGGSILAHDHYQGGRHVFPMERAKAYSQVELTEFPEISVELLNWPMTVIRLKSKNMDNLVDTSEFILKKWRNYSDETVDILANTGEVLHNTITPIARRKDDVFEMDLVLRNNRTSDEYPDGIFHPHQDVQHIKKENIGLIEVMGLAILPPRLLEEIEGIKKYLLNKADLSEVSKEHIDWVNYLENKHQKLTTFNITEIINQEIGDKFARVLEDAGVFKLDEKGKAGVLRFIDFINEG